MSNASIAGITMGVPLSAGIALIFGWRAPIAATVGDGRFIFAAAVGNFSATALDEKPLILIRPRLRYE